MAKIKYGVLKNRGFPLKPKFLKVKNAQENAQKHFLNKLYAESSEKSKFSENSTLPSLSQLFSDSLNGWKPPKPIR